jgi:TorA maturation chaperone TorD
MAWLVGCELEAKDSRDQLSYQRAQRDFLGGYLAGWLPGLETLVSRRTAAPFFRSIVALASRFASAERDYLAGTLGHSEGRRQYG